jgi:hypothetical protein
MPIAISTDTEFHCNKSDNPNQLRRNTSKNVFVLSEVRRIANIHGKPPNSLMFHTSTTNTWYLFEISESALVSRRGGATKIKQSWSVSHSQRVSATGMPIGQDSWADRTWACLGQRTMSWISRKPMVEQMAWETLTTSLCVKQCHASFQGDDARSLSWSQLTTRHSNSKYPPSIKAVALVVGFAKSVTVISQTLAVISMLHCLYSLSSVKGNSNWPTLPSTAAHGQEGAQ